MNTAPIVPASASNLPTILIAFASKHGGTQEIAAAIGTALEEEGLGVTVRSVDDVADTRGFDAVILGSAVYMGRWLSNARDFADTHADDLRTKPVWLFSSGPIGEPPKPEGDSSDAKAVGMKLGAIEHRLFNGRLDKARLGFAEKAVVWGVGAEEGDFRDWKAVAVWAKGVAGRLKKQPADVATA